MKIYLDSKDIIDLFENSKPCSPDYFNKKLRANGHELVISAVNIFEFAAPVAQGKSMAEKLNRLEELPHKWISFIRITPLELQEAKDAFLQGREYQNISPFVRRFDETCVIGKSSTSDFINYPLSQIVYDLWTEDKGIFKGIKKAGINELRRLFALDRAMDNPPSLLDGFVETIDRHLKMCKVSVPAKGLREFAEWIYNDPARCPSVRLGYEVYHKALLNIEDIPKDGDIYDNGHVGCLPYVDLLSLERRWLTYVSQANKGISMTYHTRLCKNVSEILPKL